MAGRRISKANLSGVKKKSDGDNDTYFWMRVFVHALSENPESFGFTRAQVEHVAAAASSDCLVCQA